MVAEQKPARQEAAQHIDLSSLPPQEFNSLKKSLSRILHPPQDGVPTSIKGHKHSHSPESFHIDIPQMPAAAEIALAALQYLPTPLIVLSSLKTIVLANEAMGRLLGLWDGTNTLHSSNETTTDVLRGQTLSQIGVDMLSDGVPVWVSWEKFMDNLTSSLDNDDGHVSLPHSCSGESTPVAAPETLRSASRAFQSRSPNREKTIIHDTVVDVVVTGQNAMVSQREYGQRHRVLRSPGPQVSCRMIISIWTIESQRFFTMTFTSPAARSHGGHPTLHSVPRANKPSTSTRSTKSNYSHTPTSSPASSAAPTPSPSESSATSSFLPNGAPAKCTPPVAFNEFQKVTRMKDAMLRATEIPVVAMWKDESVVFPNPAARRLLSVNTDATTDESYDFMSRFQPWSADFSRQLEDSDNPIISLCRTQQPFSSWQIGLINEKTGAKSNYDVSGHPVFDEKNGEFFAGLIAFKDVTEYTERIAMQSAENEEQFQLICDTMPQMLWTTEANGYHTWFSQRWYDYTGLTPQNSLGLGWKLPFHPDDMAETGRRWARSLATGETYNTEYRCQRHDGEWRWMLGRAMPLRDSKTGEILKWFGTCTDIQEIVDARESGRKMRQQLLDVLYHSQMNMWIVDREGRLVFFEGCTFEDMSPEDVRQMLGSKFVDVLQAKGIDNEFLNNITTSADRILRNESTHELQESEKDGRWWRCKLVPFISRAEGHEANAVVEGVIGISNEVTILRRKEQENIELLANESAAKEASKMKSSFLANMSHEIRTPIHGVLGMSEVLMDTHLSAEQTEFAQNIQRSANSLLTVVNDILDFSKIESGRLDIEEVQFSLGVVLKDVAKMLSYAAERKNLQFSSDMHLGETDDLILLGDPGRVRQILTNLLTNSIKFTSEGYVRITARIVSDTNDTTTVEFGVEDTGIGIEEDVKKTLFKPFSQADSSTARRFGGTGLGLTISKNLVDLMKGRISMQSKLGSGTTAVFSIPFKKPEFVTGPSATPLVEVSCFPDRMKSDLSLSCDDSSIDNFRKPTPPQHSPKSMASMKVNRASLPPEPIRDETSPSGVDLENIHILVVEDNSVNQQIAIRFIESFKFTVSAVWNGREALEYLLKATSDDPALQQECRLPSLILMDVQMPILDGYNATHLLRHHDPYNTIDAIKRMPIVAMTASAIQGDREKCQRAGMDDYLSKPVKRPVLEKMILKWIMKSQGARRASLAPSSIASKPDLTRSETDHSSNCPDHDYIATEWLHARGGVVPTLTSSEWPATAMGTSSPYRPTPALEAARLTSLSRSLLATEIPGAESEAEIVMRRAAAEEKARALRDAKLLHATEDQHGASHSTVVPPELIENGYERSLSFDSDGELLLRSYPGQGASELELGVMALTKENVEKLNHALEAGEGDGMPIPEAKSKAMHVSAANIPGPPPDLEIVSSSPRHSVPTFERTHGRENGLAVGSPGKKKREETGGLMVQGRSRSDWSSSTAKPGRGSTEHYQELSPS